MEKTISLICSIALLLGMIVPSVAAVEDTTCPCCGATNVTWTTMTDNMDMAPGHYRLEKDTKQKKHCLPPVHTVWTWQVTPSPAPTECLLRVLRALC